jgi:LacI family transcriptional regulator
MRFFHRPMNPSPTLKDIARVAGLSHSAVSMALRDHPRIGAATRERVKKLAQDMNYVADPRLAGLIAYRQTKQEARTREALVRLEIVQPEMPTRHSPEEEAMQARARELGYAFDVMESAGDRESLARVARVLRARGLRGLILSCGRVSSLDLVFPWEEFCVVHLNAHPDFTHFTSVLGDDYHASAMAVQRIAALGYRKIGYWEHWVTPLWAKDQFVGGFREGCRVHLSDDNPPLFRVPAEFFAHGRLGAEMRAWAEAQSLDALLESGTGKLWGEISQARKVVPVFGYACIDRDPQFTSCAGMMQNRVVHAATAVDQVHALLVMNRKGPPRVPLSIHIDSEWCSGATLPSRLGERAPDLFVGKR